MDDKTIVITLYGTKDVISDFSITLFDNTDHYEITTKAQVFCSNINDLELKDDNWIYAAVIKENQKTKFKKYGFIDFDLLASLDDKSIQKILGRIEYNVLKTALRFAKKEIVNAVLRNKSRRAAIMLIEDLKHPVPIFSERIKEARKQIGEQIQFLIRTREITIPY